MGESNFFERLIEFRSSLVAGWDELIIWDLRSLIGKRNCRHPTFSRMPIGRHVHGKIPRITRFYILITQWKWLLNEQRRTVSDWSVKTSFFRVRKSSRCFPCLDRTSIIISRFRPFVRRHITAKPRLHGSKKSTGVKSVGRVLFDSRQRKSWTVWISAKSVRTQWPPDQRTLMVWLSGKAKSRTNVLG